jgi:glycosyltransferase involved in cell wall biosynthesis
MERPLRVLHVITRLIVGGAQENTLLTCHRLDPKRFATHLVCGPQTGSEGSLLDEARQLGVRLTLVPALVREISPLRDLRAMTALLRVFRAEMPDLVHTHSSKAGILGRFAARLAGVPAVVHTVHGWGFGPQTPRGLRASYIALERAAAGLTHRLVVVSERDRDKGLQARIGRPGQYELIRSGIDLRMFSRADTDRVAKRRELGLPTDAPIIGTVGRLSDQKDPLTFVSVAEHVASRIRDARFVMVGDGPLRRDVETLIEQRGLGGRVHVLGLRRDVPEILPVMDVFVLTSRWEGLPRTLPQAMASGIPIVATRVDGVDDAIVDGSTGLLAPPGDAAGIASAICRLIENPALAKRLVTEGRCRLDEFSLDRMIDDLARLYDRLTGSATAQGPGVPERKG